MKKYKEVILGLALTFITVSAFSQSDEAQVEAAMKAYKSGIESLSTEGLSDLFMEDSQVFESGGSEGSFNHYLDHHLGPELKVFSAFDFNDYNISTIVDLPYAFTTETYVYKIVIASSGKVIEKKGVATSVLKKIEGKWLIMKTHSSSRAKK
ncbi:MAG: nuclear transport factor 2 family protein [Fulvivirga sp.]